MTEPNQPKMRMMTIAEFLLEQGDLYLVDRRRQPTQIYEVVRDPPKAPDLPKEPPEHVTKKLKR